MSNGLGLTYLKGPRFILTHRSSKHASEVLTAMAATIPATIAVMSTVPPFSMVPMDAVSTGRYDSIHVMQVQLRTVLIIVISKFNPANVLYYM